MQFITAPILLMAFAALLRADAAFLWQRRELLGQGLLSLAVSKRVPRWQALARLGRR